MKKIAALLVALLMLCSVALAEETPVITYDPAAVTVESSFLAVENWGVQFLVPNDMLVMEVTEDMAAQGTVALFLTADGTAQFSIGEAALTDADGNAIVDYESLIAFYTAQGATDMSVAMVNEIPLCSYILEAAGVMGVMALDGTGNVLTFNFAPIANADFMAIAQMIITSIQPYAAE